MWTPRGCVGGCGLWLSFMRRRLGALMQAALRPSLGLGCSSLPAQAAHAMQCLHPLLMIQGTQRLWRAMGCIIAAPINVSLEPRQHGAPGPGAQTFGLWAHQQGAVIDGPGQTLKMSSILDVKEG